MGNSCVEGVSTSGSGLDGPVSGSAQRPFSDRWWCFCGIAVEAIPTSINEAELRPPRM